MHVSVGGSTTFIAYSFHTSLHTASAKDSEDGIANNGVNPS